RRAMRWRTPCRTPSTSWTTTPGWCSSTPRTRPTGTTICAPWRTICSPVRRAARSATSTCAPSPITCVPSPSRGAWSRPPPRRGQSPEQALTTICDRLAGGLANAGVKARRLGAADIHAWLLRWFNPNPTLLGAAAEDRERFYALTRYPEEREEGEIELASGTDFAQRLFFGQPRSDVPNGLWFFDGMPHRVIVMDRLRTPPVTGHLTGETRKGGDAMNALFDQMPEDTVMCLTLVATPQDVLEAHLNHLARKA